METTKLGEETTSSRVADSVYATDELLSTVANQQHHLPHQPNAPKLLLNSSSSATATIELRFDDLKATDDDDAAPSPMPAVDEVEGFDTEGKCKSFRPWTFQAPHHRSFQLVWLSWLSCQIAVFTPAALGPIIRDNLGATQQEMSASGIAAIAGSLISRVLIGMFVDPSSLGPRRALPCFLLFCTPAVFCMAFVTTPGAFIAVRFFIGLCLGAFVVTQYTSASMFNVQIVGMTSGAAAGFGNMGAGVAELFMPLVAEGIAHSGVPTFESWRWCMLIPGGMMLLFPVLFALLAQDLPGGNYRELIAENKLVITKTKIPLKTQLGAYLNYRAWLLAVMYMFCFGVELSVNNVMVAYLSQQFNLPLAKAGGYASIFGLMPCVARTFGGWASDKVSSVHGMRGRLQLMFVLMVSSGAFCIGLANSNASLSATTAMIVLFAFTSQAAEGVVYSTVPFVSKRFTGAVSGLVGAGGSAGGVVLQAAFFYNSGSSGVQMYYPGFQWMGVAIMCVAGLGIPLIHFPPWGSMFMGPSEGWDEELYYLSEYTQEEIGLGAATTSLKFALESKSQRGSKRGSRRRIPRGNGNEFDAADAVGVNKAALSISVR